MQLISHIHAKSVKLMYFEYINQIKMQAFSYRPSAQSWFYKYKLYHIPFWFAYHFTWWSITIGNPFAAATNLVSPYFIKFLFYVIFQATAVYFNLYFLVPTYLEKSRFTAYIIYLAITIICAASLIATGYPISAFLSGQTVSQMYGFTNKNSFSYPFLVNSLPSTVASTTLAMSIKLAKNWLQTQRRQQLLEKEKLETELKFLKNQFNPHYLFNTINSIFFLIHKNPDRASASLAKFSELLRYQLYECNDLHISLGKEIGYLENFIELEKLRQNNNMDITVRIDCGHSGHTAIAPFILMTFVENAFKHVSKHTDKPNWIKVDLSLHEQQLNLVVSNSASLNEKTNLPYYGGIGLENVQRRLDLIYPGKYTLDIKNRADNFEVSLGLKLTELVLIQPLQKTA
jgi:two-component system, LytTR family, sensor kinase